MNTQRLSAAYMLTQGMFGMLQGDFAEGMRTMPGNLRIGTFATGMIRA